MKTQRICCAPLDRVGAHKCILTLNTSRGTFVVLLGSFMIDLYAHKHTKMLQSVTAKKPICNICLILCAGT